MKPEERNKAYIWDMLQAAEEILQFINGMTYQQFCNDKKTRYAVERQLLVIGEAANHLTESFQIAYPAIKWKSIIGLRNIIAHEYGEILEERIWITANENILELINQLKPLLPQNPEDCSSL